MESKSMEKIFDGKIPTNFKKFLTNYEKFSANYEKFPIIIGNFRPIEGNFPSIYFFLDINFIFNTVVIKLIANLIFKFGKFKVKINNFKFLFIHAFHFFDIERSQNEVLFSTTYNFSQSLT